MNSVIGDIDALLAPLARAAPARDMLSVLSAVILALGASALETSPFAPPSKPADRIVRLLAPSGAFTPKTLREFERESGAAVAYDAYGDPQRIPFMMKDAAYDVVILPGPELARAIAGGELRKIDKAQIANARRVAPQVAAKLMSYDAGGAYAIAWGWSATGLLYDVGKAPPLARRRAEFWGAALAPEVARKLAPCGVALPDARDEVFVAAWRLMGVNPSALRERDVKAAADHNHSRPRGGAPAGFARPDHRDRGRRGLPDVRRRGAGRDSFAPQPRGRRRLGHSLRRAEGGRPDCDRRACRAARRAASA